MGKPSGGVVVSEVDAGVASEPATRPPRAKNANANASKTKKAARTKRHAWIKPGTQLTIAQRPRRGGPRPGSGPKPGKRPHVRHRTRPRHAYYDPLHITMRAARGLPSFRSQLLYAVIEQCIRTTRREDFRFVEYSVQDDHLHFIAEGKDKKAVESGMRSFTARLVYAIKGALGRKRACVFGDRYDRRDLTTPREVRNALVYVLANVKKHYRLDDGVPSIDPCSSARWFEGWSSRYPRTCPWPDTPRPTALPRTHLLAVLWKKHGLIDPTESPKRAA